MYNKDDTDTVNSQNNSIGDEDDVRGLAASACPMPHPVLPGVGVHRPSSGCCDRSGRS